MPNPSHQQIESLAYQLWQDRGSPTGTPEEDWFNAERKFTDLEKSNTRLLEIAREVGGTLGSITAIFSHVEPPEEPPSA